MLVSGRHRVSAGRPLVANDASSQARFAACRGREGTGVHERKRMIEGDGRGSRRECIAGERSRRAGSKLVSSVQTKTFRSQLRFQSVGGAITLTRARWAIDHLRTDMGRPVESRLPARRHASELCRPIDAWRQSNTDRPVSASCIDDAGSVVPPHPPGGIKRRHPMHSVI